MLLSILHVNCHESLTLNRTPFKKKTETKQNNELIKAIQLMMFFLQIL